MPYLLFLKKRQNLKMSSAVNHRWRVMGENGVEFHIYHEIYMELHRLTAHMSSNLI